MNITNSGTAAANIVAVDIAVTPVVLDSGSRTITNLASLRGQGAPTTSGGTITVTNGSYAMWVAGGESRFDGIISANAGVNFPDTQAASGDVNTLDDYEEGEHAVALTDNAGDVTSIALHSDYNTLHYTKIGRQVTVQGQIVISSFSGSWQSDGFLRISLPFTSASLTDAYKGVGNVSTHNVDMTSGTEFVLIVDENVATAKLYTNTDNSGQGYGQPQSNGQIWVNITYFTAT